MYIYVFLYMGLDMSLDMGWMGSFEFGGGGVVPEQSSPLSMGNIQAVIFVSCYTFLSN
jgi:hypothetical protein